MATRISVAAQNAAVNGVTALLDAGASGGHIEIRTGGQPATVGTAATGTVLATLTLSKPAFGGAASGTGTANAVTSATASASGTAGWFRAYDSNSNAVTDGAITATGGGGDMTLDNVSIVSGGTVNVTSWTITEPAG